MSKINEKNKRKMNVEVQETELAEPKQLHGGSRNQSMMTTPTSAIEEVELPAKVGSKLWDVKCKKDSEKEVVACLLQKSYGMQIKSAIAPDHIKGNIYVEADKEYHVREACKGLRNVILKNIVVVPRKEMIDILMVKNEDGNDRMDLANDVIKLLKVGDRVKIASGAKEGQTGTIITMEGKVNTILLDQSFVAFPVDYDLCQESTILPNLS